MDYMEKLKFPFIKVNKSVYLLENKLRRMEQ